MIVAGKRGQAIKTTSWKVVLPFYLYASCSFVLATLLLVFSAKNFLGHYFHPHILAITHIMALGWATMIILGASFQLLPVFIEQNLYSEKLAYASFVLAGTGIPFLVYGFFNFNMGFPAQFGGILMVAAFLVYLFNIAKSMSKSKQESVQAYFVFTATIWLVSTATLGLMLVFNFTLPLMPKNSFDYLALHAHIGIVGWFLLLIIGIASRLIPMFLISKYSNIPVLWWIYGLINGGLISFVFIFLYTDNGLLLLLPLFALFAAILLFGYYVYQCCLQRIRKKVDEHMKLSFLSVWILILPFVLLVPVIYSLLNFHPENNSLVLAYGFIIFFGWIGFLLVGMTFKTLPFIVWTKVYQQLSGKGKTPNPKDLFSQLLFNWMAGLYITGFVLFTMGILIHSLILLQLAAGFMVLSASIYSWMLVKLLLHKPLNL